MDNKSFLGKGWSFPPEFRKTETPTLMVKEEQDIQQSLSILLQTTPGERIHRFDFGCNLKKFAYEEMTTTVQTLICNTVKDAILSFESRIILNQIQFKTDRIAEGVVSIYLDYTIRSTNNRANFVFPFYLREGTNVDL